jgi:hypothetical protein
MTLSNIPAPATYVDDCNVALNLIRNSSRVAGGPEELIDRRSIHGGQLSERLLESGEKILHSQPVKV